MAGTTANSVNVGLIETDIIKNLDQTIQDVFKAEFIPAQGKPGMGQPEDVADVVGMLCSHDARWITGTVVGANGGAYAGI